MVGEREIAPFSDFDNPQKLSTNDPRRAACFSRTEKTQLGDSRYILLVGASHGCGSQSRRPQKES